MGEIHPFRVEHLLGSNPNTSRFLLCKLGADLYIRALVNAGLRRAPAELLGTAAIAIPESPQPRPRPLTSDSSEKATTQAEQPRETQEKQGNNHKHKRQTRRPNSDQPGKTQAPEQTRANNSESPAGTGGRGSACGRGETCRRRPRRVRREGRPLGASGGFGGPPPALEPSWPHRVRRGESSRGACLAGNETLA